MKNLFTDFQINETISDQITYRELPSGLNYWWIETKSFSAAIAVCGGQLIWHSHSNNPKPTIWMSENSHLDNSKSLRGGIPVCWPWFGRHPTNRELPNHGLVRNIPWQLDSFDYDAEKDSITVTLSPIEIDQLAEYIAAGITLSQQIVISSNIDISLTTNNLSKDIFNFSVALHSYFNVEDIHQTELHGLTQSHYISEKTNWQETDSPRLYKFREETDRVHTDSADHIEIHGPDQTIVLNQTGHNSVIVWNPWQTVSENTPGMGKDVWQQMLCVEPAAFKPFLNLKPNSSHTLRQTIDIA